MRVRVSRSSSPYTCYYVSQSDHVPCISARSLFSRPLALLTHTLRFTVLIGAIDHAKHLISKERLPFICIYFTSLGLTLYFSRGVSACNYLQARSCADDARQIRSFLGSLTSAVVQVMALVSYVLTYFPGGESMSAASWPLRFADALAGVTALRFGGKLALSGARSALPIGVLATGDQKK